MDRAERLEVSHNTYQVCQELAFVTSKPYEINGHKVDFAKLFDLAADATAKIRVEGADHLTEKDVAALSVMAFAANVIVSHPESGLSKNYASNRLGPSRHGYSSEVELRSAFAKSVRKGFSELSRLFDHDWSTPQGALNALQRLGL